MSLFLFFLNLILVAHVLNHILDLFCPDLFYCLSSSRSFEFVHTRLQLMLIPGRRRFYATSCSTCTRTWPRRTPSPAPYFVVAGGNGSKTSKPLTQRGGWNFPDLILIWFLTYMDLLLYFPF
jgi:hypothetical protein